MTIKDLLQYVINQVDCDIKPELLYIASDCVIYSIYMGSGRSDIKISEIVKGDIVTRTIASDTENLLDM